MLLIENGRLTLDLAVDLPRAGRRGTARFAALEQQVLARVLAKPGHGGSDGGSHRVPKCQQEDTKININ